MWKQFTVRLCIGGIALSALASSAQAQPDADLNGAMNHALEQGCLKSLSKGAVKAEAEMTDSRPPHGDIGLSVTTSNGGCTISAAKGDGAQLRAALLQSLDARGYKLSPFGVYHPYTSGEWTRVQETYCFRSRGAVYLATLSSSTTQDRPFEVSIMRDSKGIAAAKGLCQTKA
ncbi:hypothetical protein [Asticcacaulis sp. YBE204]|uniref:hypothetical protein n=1 Tax=Asticcacaulis sp. YBE204 TaxID=1282363 RepID=UPI0003C3B77D|nr:hypothetical protein [Asticcacaulis sp. YBE204]ESQ79961.1 hypothetical protein AEYBE204_08930 [Asticcacaulis sp. YBE204]